MRTHENYIMDVLAVIATRLNAKEKRVISKIKVAYGAGQSGIRGVTYYRRWKNGSKAPHPFVEICAFGESGLVQICGTTFHECAHVLAGHEAAHGPDWKAKCEYLGLVDAKASGHSYTWDTFAPDIRKLLKAIPKPKDGQPIEGLANRIGRKVVNRPCSHGIGSRGGKSRGVGSGSRMVKVSCLECGYTVRTSMKWLKVGLPRCPTHKEMTPDVLISAAMLGIGKA